MQSIIKQHPQYINETECSSITGLAISTLRNQRFEHRGIPYVKLGRAVRYSLADVIEYVEQRKVNTLDA